MSEPIRSISFPNTTSSSEQVLFSFDNWAIPFRHGVRLKMLSFEANVDARSNLVISPGPEGTPDCNGLRYNGTVLQVNGELWMWYLGQGKDSEQKIHLRICFAQSTDGRNWVKPSLGLVEYGGSRENNLVELDGGQFSAGGCLVFHDPEEADADRRFKMLFISDRYGMKFAVAYSPDGVQWKEPADNPRGPFFEPAGATKWKGVYYINGQAHDAHYPAGVRKLFTHLSYDFENWTQVACLSFRRDSVAPQPITTTGSVDGEQVHLGAGLWNRGNVIIGFYGQWHGHPSNDRRWVSIDLGLVVSHDALHFHEPVPSFRIVNSCEAVSWVPPASFPFERAPALQQGQGFANIGNETLFWYSVWGVAAAGIRMARWGRDRLGHLEPGGIEPWMDPNHSPHIISAPLEVAGRPTAFYLNVDGLGLYANIKVSILDEQFRPLPGYSAQDCTGPTEAGFRQRVIWAGSDSITSSGPIRVRVDFGGIRPEDLRFYALYIEDASHP